MRRPCPYSKNIEYYGESSIPPRIFEALSPMGSQRLTIENYDPRHGISLNGRSRIITVELSKVKSVLEKPVKEMTDQEQWAVYFRFALSV